MDLLQNPFHILSATPRDNRQRIMELADERSLSLAPNECIQARSDLTNPRKRLAAELAWLPGISPKRANNVFNLLKSDPKALSLMDLPSMSRANVFAFCLSRLTNYASRNVAYLIHEIACAFEEVDSEQLCTMINEERTLSGFPPVTDVSLVDAELQERRLYFKQVFKSALNGLAPRDLVETVTVAIVSASDHGEKHAPILIDDLIDSYEVEAHIFLEREEENIRTLVEKLQSALDAEHSDSALSPMIDQLIKVVKNWDFVAQPIQVSSKSRGLDHGASKRVASLVRSLAIHMFNNHDKLNFSRQLTDMLQELFAEVVEVAELAAEDAHILGNIADHRFLSAEVAKIKDLAEQIQSDVDRARADSHLSPKVSKLCLLINNWTIDPKHDASQHAAWLVRDLAVNMFNNHDKLAFSQQLTKALLAIFSDAGEISERIMDDAKALREIAAKRSKLTAQFKEFNLHGSSFSYKGKTYSINDIQHIGFYRSITTHKVNFVETGKTEKVNIYLTMSNTEEVNISVDEAGFFFNKNKSAQIKTIAEFYSYLSHVTFDRRVQFYESQISSWGYFVYDNCYFYPKDKIVFRGKEFVLGATSFFRSYGCVEMRKKDFGVLDKIKREISFTKIPHFSTIVDTDVIFHLLDKHFSLTWKS